MQQAGPRLEHAGQLLRHAQRRPAPLESRAPSSRSTSSPCSRAARSTPGTTTPSAGPISTSPVSRSSCRPRVLLQLRPQAIAFQQQRHVVGMLEVRLPDDPRLPVRAAAVVRRGEAVDPQHAQPAARKLPQRRAAHAAGAQHDRVVASSSAYAVHRAAALQPSRCDASMASRFACATLDSLAAASRRQPGWFAATRIVKDESHANPPRRARRLAAACRSSALSPELNVLFGPPRTRQEHGRPTRRATCSTARPSGPWRRQAAPMAPLAEGSLDVDSPQGAFRAAPASRRLAARAADRGVGRRRGGRRPHDSHAAGRPVAGAAGGAVRRRLRRRRRRRSTLLEGEFARQFTLALGQRRRRRRRPAASSARSTPRRRRRRSIAAASTNWCAAATTSSGRSKSRCRLAPPRQRRAGAGDRRSSTPRSPNAAPGRGPCRAAARRRSQAGRDRRPAALLLAGSRRAAAARRPTPTSAAKRSTASTRKSPAAGRCWPTCSRARPPCAASWPKCTPTARPTASAAWPSSARPSACWSGCSTTSTPRWRGWPARTSRAAASPPTPTAACCRWPRCCGSSCTPCAGR